MSDLHRPNPQLQTSQLEISEVDESGGKVLITPKEPKSADAWLTTDTLCNPEDYR